jgi:hypothetical protein
MKIYNILIISSVLLSACNGTEQRPERTFREHGEPKFSHKDEQVLSFTDVNNPIQGYSSEDKESLDLAFAEMILKSFDLENIEYSDMEGNIITKEEAKSLLKFSLFEAEQSDEHEESSLRSVEKNISANDIVQIVTRENWYLNEENFSVQKMITHVAPVIYTFDTDGDVRGKKMLFWVKLN